MVSKMSACTKNLKTVVSKCDGSKIARDVVGTEISLGHCSKAYKQKGERKALGGSRAHPESKWWKNHC